MADPEFTFSSHPPQPQPHPSSIPTLKSPRSVSASSWDSNNSNGSDALKNSAATSSNTDSKLLTKQTASSGRTSPIDDPDNPFLDRSKDIPGTPRKNLQTLSRLSSGGKGAVPVSHIPVLSGKPPTAGNLKQSGPAFGSVMGEKPPLVPQNGSEGPTARPGRRDVTPQQTLKKLSRVTPPANLDQPRPAQPVFTDQITKGQTDPSDPFNVLPTLSSQTASLTGQTKISTTPPSLDDERPPDSYDEDFEFSTFKTSFNPRSTLPVQNDLEEDEQEEEDGAPENGFEPYDEEEVGESHQELEEEVENWDDDFEQEQDENGFSHESVDFGASSPLGRRFLNGGRLDEGSEGELGDEDEVVADEDEGELDSIADAAGADVEVEGDDIGDEDAFMELADTKANVSMGMFNDDDDELGDDAEDELFLDEPSVDLGNDTADLSYDEPLHDPLDSDNDTQHEDNDLDEENGPRVQDVKESILHAIHKHWRSLQPVDLRTKEHADVSDQVYLALREILKEVKGMVGKIRQADEEERTFYENMNATFVRRESVERERQGLHEEHARILGQLDKSREALRVAQREVERQTAHEKNLTQKAVKARIEVEELEKKLEEKQLRRLAATRRSRLLVWKPIAVFVVVLMICLVLECLAVWAVVSERHESHHALGPRDPSTKIEGGLPARPAQGLWVLPLRDWIAERLWARAGFVTV
ncbi:hypothetical protein HDV00_002821 [Rhizophlyctis rosea]|nr:hypothetical protein HDV00_002821 [Rhizophlyctis rosea]